MVKWNCGGWQHLWSSLIKNKNISRIRIVECFHDLTQHIISKQVWEIISRRSRLLLSILIKKISCYLKLTFFCLYWGLVSTFNHTRRSSLIAFNLLSVDILYTSTLHPLIFPHSFVTSITTFCSILDMRYEIFGYTM